jgi:hypothetical protein
VIEYLFSEQNFTITKQTNSTVTQYIYATTLPNDAVVTVYISTFSADTVVTFANHTFTINSLLSLFPCSFLFLPFLALFQKLTFAF